ncbi:hypothetical protein B0H13DRAFT_854922 [Mycena leptocephala]|nr:hypothetical protein B0H13DRAFT_854922 [Mycena leptocephala]
MTTKVMFFWDSKHKRTNVKMQGTPASQEHKTPRGQARATRAPGTSTISLEARTRKITMHTPLPNGAIPRDALARVPESMGSAPPSPHAATAHSSPSGKSTRAKEACAPHAARIHQCAAVWSKKHRATPRCASWSCSRAKRPQNAHRATSNHLKSPSGASSTTPPRRAQSRLTCLVRAASPSLHLRASAAAPSSARPRTPRLSPAASRTKRNRERPATHLPIACPCPAPSSAPSHRLLPSVPERTHLRLLLVFPIRIFVLCSEEFERE